MGMVAKLLLKSGNLESGAENNISILLVLQNIQGYSAIMSPVMDVVLKVNGGNLNYCRSLPKKMSLN